MRPSEAVSRVGIAQRALPNLRSSTGNAKSYPLTAAMRISSVHQGALHPCAVIPFSSRKRRRRFYQALRTSQVRGAFFICPFSGLPIDFVRSLV